MFLRHAVEYTMYCILVQTRLSFSIHSILSLHLLLQSPLWYQIVVISFSCYDIEIQFKGSIVILFEIYNIYRPSIQTLLNIL